MAEDQTPELPATPGRDVFISYASQDRGVADAACNSLESAGVACWIAPRDVTPGEFYAESIVHAIDSSKVTVLVLSQNGATSQHVLREVERATSRRHPVVSLRIDLAPLPAGLEYFLNTSQWLDASATGVDQALPSLVNAVKSALALPPGAVRTDPGSSRHNKGNRLSRPLLAMTAAVVVAATYLAVEKAWHSKHVANERPAAGAALVATLVIPEKSIAVLPFVDMSEKKDQEYFADGMAEEVLDLLAKMPALKVIGRTSSFQFKSKSEDLRTIGAKLGAANVVEGSVRKAGSRIRVTAQLIDAGSGVHRWSESYDRDFGEVLALQQEIATSIARALQLTVGADELRPPRRLPSVEAYTLYLRGRALQDRQQAIPLSQALGNFEQALALDPSFLGAAEAAATTQIAEGLDGSTPPRVAWRRAREAAERALRIDSKSAPAHAVLGLVHAVDEFDWNAADAEFSKALAADPRDPVSLDYAARVAHARGKYDEALQRIGASLALDPLNPYAQQTLGEMLYTIGDLTGAELAFRKSLSISPTSDGSHYSLGRIYLARGQLQAALKEMQAEVAIGSTESGLALVYHALGRNADSDSVLARVSRAEASAWPYGVAVIYAYRGERDQAFEWLEKDYELRDPDLLMFIRGDPELVRLRGDQRYTALLRKLNLVE